MDDMKEEKKLLAEIDAFLADSGMGPAYFGAAACGNSRLVHRLRNGARVQLGTAAKVRAFIKARRKKIQRGARNKDGGN